MKFFPVNPDLDKKMDFLMKKIHQHKNGETADMIKNSGANYHLNYGVSLVHLREMARGLEKNNDLARRLWFREIRETMIIATMVANPGKMAGEEINRWGRMINTVELSEQLGRNLLCNPYVGAELLTGWLEGDHFFMQYAAAMGIGWRFRFFPETGFENPEILFPRLKILCTEPRFKGAGSFLLKMAGRFSQKCRSSVVFIADEWKTADNALIRQVGDDVKYELEPLIQGALPREK